MKEIDANIWDFYGKKKSIIYVPVIAKIDYRRRMMYGSRGLACQAKRRLPWFLKASYQLVNDYGWGARVLSLVYPNHPMFQKLKLGIFPVKGQAGIYSAHLMIEMCGSGLRSVIRNNPGYTFYIPRIGCGNAGYRWEDVKPELAGYLEDLQNVVIVHNSKRKAHYVYPNQVVPQQVQQQAQPRIRF